MLPQNRITQQQIDAFPSYVVKEMDFPLRLSTIYVSPDTEIVRSVIGKTLHLLSNTSEIVVKYFKTADDVLAAYINQSSHDLYPDIKGINFAVLSQNQSSYTLRMASNDIIPSEESYEISSE